MKSLTTTAASAIFALLASGITAQADPGYYFGVGAGITHADSKSDFGTSSSGDFGTLNLALGRRFENNNLFYAIEGSADISFGGKLKYTGVSCSSGAAAPYFCDHTATIRLRGQLGTEMGSSGYEVFGSLGYALMYGNGAVAPSGDTEPGSTGGATIGVGVQRALNNGSKLRLELNHDMLSNTVQSNDGFTPEWNATSISVSFVKGF